MYRTVNVGEKAGNLPKETLVILFTITKPKSSLFIKRGDGEIREQ